MKGERRAHLRTTDERLILERGDLSLSFDRRNGALREVTNAEAGTSLSVTEPGSPPLEWTVGGREEHAPPQAAIQYEGARTRGGDLEFDDADLLRSASGVTVRTAASTDDWSLVCTYALPRDAMRIEWSFDLTYRGDDEVRLRRAHVPFVASGLGDGWHLDVPGAPVPPSTPLEAIDDGQFLEWGARRTHTGLVGRERPDGGGLATWAFSRTYPFELTVSKSGDAVTSAYDLWTAARLAPDMGVSVRSLWLAPFAGSWEGWLSTFKSWWDEVELHTPDNSPDWIERAAIFEAHVGTATFCDGFEYAPYPAMADLCADLPRIAALGFDAVQLMPRQPYPSYVLVDAEQPTAWGDPDALETLITCAHALDLRVILDVVLHGVIDRNVLAATVDSIDEHGLLEGDPDPVAAYVRNHLPHWAEHVSDRHRLVCERPGWFVRDDSGNIAHRYTNALDLANPEVQSYVVDRLERWMTRFDVDGFRLDAPIWNAFPNWAENLAYPAGHAPLGAVELFRQARRRLRTRDQDVALYVEASGPLFRESSDLNYNYDEIWLLDAVLGGDATRFGDPVLGEITAAEMAAWLARRDDAIPDGARTAHHVDSHDTFWWPEPGNKWFRERYGEAAAKAAVAAFALIDGAFMLYAGAETGQEPFLRRVLDLRSRLPELADGTCTVGAVDADDPAVFTALRRHKGRHSVVAVSFSSEPLSATIDAPPTLAAGRSYVVRDALGEELLATDRSPGSTCSISFAPYQPRLLVFRSQ